MLDGGAEKKIAENNFNEVSQLITKKLGNISGSSFLQTLDYTYHLRGWLGSVNNPDNLGSDLFAYRLYYDTTPSVAQSLNKFNGNIVSMDWRTKTPGIAERHRYDYSYDGLNQLKSAKKMRWIPECAGSAPCNEWTNYYEGWSGNYSYDLNGNIQTLNRAGTTYYNDDQLSYSYSGNQIQSITDNASSTYKNNGFVDGVNATEEYLYDANGNMYSDLNKGITDITYNRMNLPEVITFSSGNEIHYLYDAAGSKLQKITYPAGGGQTTTDYSGGFVYTNNTVDFFAFSEGRVRKVSGNWQYEYDLKDHLGNVRATFTNNNGTATLLQADSYYPFGYKMPGLSYQNGAENKFTYNGKELEGEFGLNWYHYGVRYYDPVIGRWWVTDPVDQYSSPYSYVGSNPIVFIDPDGAEGCDFYCNQRTGETIWVQNETAATIAFEGDIWVNTKNDVEVIGGLLVQQIDMPVLTCQGCSAAPNQTLVTLGYKSLIDVKGMGAVEPVYPVARAMEYYGAARSVYSLARMGYNSLKFSASAADNVAVHGNSLRSQRSTWGYKLYENDGTFLKNGITSQIVAEKRYTRSFMEGKHMVKRLFPNRLEAYKWEYGQNQILRGPLNLNDH